MHKIDGRSVAQLALFNMDSPLRGDVQGEQNLACFPFFSLSKKPQQRSISYQGHNVSIEVRPSARGLATIYDKEVLLYIASLMSEKLMAGEQVERIFTFTAHDFFRVTGENRSASSYDRLAGAIERLQGTTIKTNIEAGGEGTDQFFSWVAEAKINYTNTSKAGQNGAKRKMKSVQIQVCDWLIRAIIKDQRTLRYHHDYFSLSPIERRLYEIAHSTKSDENIIDIPMLDLYSRLGSSDMLPKKFKHYLKSVIAKQSLPEYDMSLLVDSVNPNDVLVRFMPKHRAIVTKSADVEIAA